MNRRSLSKRLNSRKFSILGDLRKRGKTKESSDEHLARNILNEQTGSLSSINR